MHRPGQASIVRRKLLSSPPHLMLALSWAQCGAGRPRAQDMPEVGEEACDLRPVGRADRYGRSLQDELFHCAPPEAALCSWQMLLLPHLQAGGQLFGLEEAPLAGCAPCISSLRFRAEGLGILYKASVTANRRQVLLQREQQRRPTTGYRKQVRPGMACERLRNETSRASFQETSPS